MATEVKRRRGTTLEHTTTNGGFTGAEGELTVDTTKDTVVVHDGSTLGGFPLLREDFSNVTTLKVDTTYSETGNEVQGEMFWNSDEETVTLVTNGVNFDLGQTVEIHVNSAYDPDDPTPITINKGEVVYAFGTLGNSGRITVKKMIADGTIAAKRVLGIAAENIQPEGEGKVIKFGKLRKINTNSYNEGDILWVSTSSAGAFQTTEPSAGDISLPLAYVVTKSATVGEIFVRVTPIDENAYQAYDADLSTIAGLAKTDGNFIVGNGSAWVAESGATARTSLGLGNVEDVALSTYTGQGGALDNQYIANGANYVTQTDTDALYDDYNYFSVTNGSSTFNVGSQQTMSITASGASSLAYDTETRSINITSTDTDTNYYLSAVNWNSGTGDLGFTVTGGTNLTANLDGRYLTSLPSHNHNDLYYTETELNGGQLDNRYYTESEINTFLSQKDNYSSWTVSDTVNEEDVTSGFTLEFEGTNGIAVSYSTSTKRITIDGSGAGGGDITAVNTATNSGLSGGVTSGDASLSLNINNLAVLSASQGNESLAILDGTTTKKIALNNISLSHFNDDLNYITSETSHADVVVDGDFTANGLMKRTGAGTYTTITDSSSNWTTGYNRSLTGTTSFDTSTGVLTLNQQSGGTVTQNLDGRYLPLSGGTLTGTLTVQAVVAQSNAQPKYQLIETDTTNENKEILVSGGDFFIRNLNDNGTVPSEANIFKISHEGVVTLKAQDTTTDTNLNALFQDSNGVLKRRTLGSNAFNSTAFLTSFTETDPVFSASAASGITSSNITNWNAAYNNHITAVSFNTGNGVLTLTQNDTDTITTDLDGRYLTSYTETDPVFSASEAASITSTDTSQWDTAYTYSQVGHLPLAGGTLTGSLTVNAVIAQSNAQPKIQLKETDTTDEDKEIMVNGGDFFIRNLNDDGTVPAGENILKISHEGNVTLLAQTTTASTSLPALFQDGTTGTLYRRTLGSLAYSSATYDNYSSWSISDDGAASTTTIGSGDNLNIVGGTGITAVLTSANTLTITNTANGDITSVTAGTGLSGGGTSGGVTLALDFSELTDMTADVSGTTELILQNGTVESRKAINEVKLSFFNNDAGWTSNVGDITGVTAGTGLTGGGTSGTVTLNVSGLTTSEFSAATLLNSSETFSSSDAIIMTSAAIESYVTGLGYTTNTGDITGVTAGSGLTGGGTSGTVTVSHADTSSQTSVDGSGGSVIQDVTLDDYGHVTALGTTDLDNRYLTLSGGSLTGNLTIGGTATPTIFFNGTSDAGIDMAIKATPEGIDIYEPEDSNKIHFRVYDDTGVDAPFGYWINGTRILDSSRQLSNVTYGGNTIFHDGYHPNADTLTTARTISLGGDLSGSASFNGSADITISATVTDDSHTHDGRYYTETESDSRFVNVTGDTMSGNLTINGTLSATVKSFNIVHPTQEGKRLVYGVLEGNEHAVFVRGRSQSKVIELPEEWRGLVDPSSITVQLTAIGNAKIYYFKSCKDNKVYIGSSGLNWKYDYFYLIHATRVDVEPLQTVQDAN